MRILFAGLLGGLLLGCTTQPSTNSPNAGPSAEHSGQASPPGSADLPLPPPPPPPVDPEQQTAPGRRGVGDRSPYPLALRSSCFASQIRDEPWLPAAAGSIVVVVNADANGNRSIGTGWVVRGSGVHGGLANAIVTTMHGTDTTREGGIIAVTSTIGRPIGWAEIVAEGATSSAEAMFWDGRSTPRGDIAVLRMRGFAPGGAEIYAAMEGIELAPAQHTKMLSGDFSSPGGIEFGTSGSPVLDPNGRAIGIVTRRRDPNQGGMWGARVEIEAGDPFRISRLGFAHATKPVRLLERSTSFVEPIFSPRILMHLGPAGQGVTLRPTTDRSAVSVTIPGLPLSGCVIFRGSIAPL